MATADQLTEAIRQLHAMRCAIDRFLLDCVAEYAAGEAYRDDGSARMSNWLAAELAVSESTAARMVRVAEKLGELPELASALEHGRMSFDQLAAVTKWATSETEAELVEQVAGMSVAGLERWAARETRVRKESAPSSDPVDTCWLTTRRTRRGTVRITSELPAAEGAIVVTALERGAEQLPDHPDQVQAPFRMKMAQALVERCSLGLAADRDADRATVVLYADITALQGGEGILELDGGIPLDVDTARRMMCDCRLEMVVTDPCGHPIGIGRASQQVPRWLRRQVLKRDGHRCVFPGCGRSRWLECHHVRWWIRGGRTDLDNLVAVCRFHHDLVHKEGWSIRWLDKVTPVFLRPDGRPYAPKPEPIRPDVQARLYRMLGIEVPEASEPGDRQRGSDATSGSTPTLNDPGLLPGEQPFGDGDWPWASGYDTS